MWVITLTFRICNAAVSLIAFMYLCEIIFKQVLGMKISSSRCGLNCCDSCRLKRSLIFVCRISSSCVLIPQFSFSVFVLFLFLPQQWWIYSPALFLPMVASCIKAAVELRRICLQNPHAPPTDMYLFIEKNKITVLWPAGLGMPDCLFSEGQSLGWSKPEKVDSTFLFSAHLAFCDTSWNYSTSSLTVSLKASRHC